LSQPNDHPIELQAYAYQEIRTALAPFLSPDGERALQDVWLTKILPGPARYAAYDDGDWALVWAELRHLRRLYEALSKRENPPPRTGLRPIDKLPSAAVTSAVPGLQPFSGMPGV
jgi:hypothetical protein